jgi:outer membrane protein OmpA-like peptidoglycan-associated protein
LGLFDKSSSATKTGAAPDPDADAKAGAAGIAALGAAGLAADEPSTPKTSDIPDVAAAAKSGAADVAALGTAGLAAGAAGLAAGASAIKGTLGGIPSAAGIASGGGAQAFANRVLDDGPVAKSGWARWLPWLLLAAALLLLLWYLGLFRWGTGTHAPVTSSATPVAGSSVTPGAGNDMSATPVATAPIGNTAAPAPAPATAAAAIPTGAGVTSEVRDGKPAVNVYFATGKADVASAFTPAAAALRSYLDQNAGSKLTVSGFTDKTGNAALNAELSKNRAKAVEAALVTAGIPAASIELVKPSDSTDVNTTNAGARRVEVTVK